MQGITDPAQEIANGVDELVKIVKNGELKKNTKFKTPQRLVLDPPKTDLKQSKYKAMFEGSLGKSAQFAERFAKAARDNQAEFFDVAAVVPFGEADDEIRLNAKITATLQTLLPRKSRQFSRTRQPLQE